MSVGGQGIPLPPGERCVAHTDSGPPCILRGKVPASRLGIGLPSDAWDRGRAPPAGFCLPQAHLLSFRKKRRPPPNGRSLHTRRGYFMWLSGSMPHSTLAHGHPSRRCRQPSAGSPHQGGSAMPSSTAVLGGPCAGPGSSFIPVRMSLTPRRNRRQAPRRHGWACLRLGSQVPFCIRRWFFFGSIRPPKTQP